MRAVIAAGCLALTATLATAQTDAEKIRTDNFLDQMQSSFRNVADEVFPSLVYIEYGVATDDRDKDGAGSGFIVDYDTESNTFYVATNHHIVSGVVDGLHDFLQITTLDGRSFEAVLVGSDPRYDVALLSFEYSTSELSEWSPSISSIGDSDAVREGDLVYALGSPGKLPATVTAGIVSHASREGSDRVGAYIQTDAAINLGNSGGPLVSLRDGKVIGINTFTITRPESPGSIGLGFALPINAAMRIIENLKDYGTPRHGYIGVEYSPRGATDVMDECDWDSVDVEMDDETWATISEKVSTIMDVTPLGPADRHGLKPGDVMYRVDGEAASVVFDIDRPPGYKSLVRRIDAMTPGTNSAFKVFRNCELIEITVQAGALEDVGDQVFASWPGMLLDAALSVVAVSESGVAAGVGIEEGDAITHVNNDRIDNLGQFYRRIDICRTKRCSLGIRRDGVLSWSPDFMVPLQ